MKFEQRMPSKPILIKNGLLVTVNKSSDVYSGDILVYDSKIADVGPELSHPDANVFDASDYFITPGFVQTHVHLCQTLFRNMADDLSLLDWLKKKIWPLEGQHTEQSLRISAQLGIAELLLGGTTTIMDMGTVNHMHTVFEEIESSGIRAFCGKTMMDWGELPENLYETTTASIDQSLKLLETWHNKADGRIKYAFAPRFVLSCTKELLSTTYSLSKEYGVPFHSHASENLNETKIVEQIFGARNIKVFEKLGIAGPEVFLAHCIWLDDDEKEIMEQNNMKVLHCPSANLKLGSGIAPVPEYIDRGISVSLGADGAPCNNNLDIFSEMKLAALIQKPINGPTAMSSETVFRMATIEGAKALGLQDQIGSIEVGKKADLVFCNLNEVRSIPFENIYSKVVYSTNSSGVSHLMIDGKWIVRNRELSAYDINDVILRANQEVKNFIH
jgi:cytosine/adenosine deaminase-related metal-dependent hydrolase